MEIPASSMTDGNINGSAGNILQMIANTDAGQTATAGTGTTNGGTVEASFSDVLTQQITALLQSGEAEASQSSTIISDLSATLSKLTDESQENKDDASSELAMLALLTQTIAGKIGNDPVNSDDMSAIPSDGDALSDAGINSFPSEIEMSSQNAGGLMTTDAGLSSDANVSDQSDIPLSANGGKNFSENLKEVAQNSDADLENALGQTEHDALSEKIGDEQKSVNVDTSQKQNQGVDLNESSILKEMPAGSQEAAAAESSFLGSPNEGDILKKLTEAETLSGTAADDLKSIHLKNALTEKYSEAGVATEKEISKTGVNDKTMLSGSNQRPSESVISSKENQGLNIGTASDSLKQQQTNLSTGDAAQQNENGSGGQTHDSKNNVSSKDFNQVLMNADQESMSEADQFKAEFKSKGFSADQNSDNRAINAVASTTSAQTNSDTAEILPSSIINRVATEFRENLMTEGGRVKITLTPPDLGTLEMDVSVQNSKVKVMLIADNKDVQRILTGNLESLKGSLQSQGLTIERCDVMMQNQRDSYGQAFYGQQAFGQEQTWKERNSKQETLDEKSVTRQTAINVNIQVPVYRQQYDGSESISLFA